MVSNILSVPGYTSWRGEEMTDQQICAIFDGAGDFIRRELNCGGLTIYAYFIDGLTAGGEIAEYVFKPLYENGAESMDAFYQQSLAGAVYSCTAAACTDANDAARKLVNGFCVVLFPGAGAIAYEVKTPVRRSPAPPQVENTVKGAKDAFVESMRVNTSLLRRHLRAPELRMYQTAVGKRSQTNVSILYMEGVTDPALVERMKHRLKSIQVDGFCSPAAVEESITGSRRTAFPLLQYTERTDRFAQGLMEGRVGLIVDGLPLGYLAPVDLGYFMESPEDRGRDYISASAVRILRWIALVTGLLLPGVYIALVSFHPSLIPQSLQTVIMNNREAVPVSAAAEVLGLLIAFELLQESGIHLPQAVGQSVSIIGGIVMGTAAVEAGLISSMALISVSVAGICGFVQPNRDLATACRVWRFLIAAVSAVAGLLGTAVMTVALLIHLARLKSMGEPYLYIKGSLLRRRLKDEKD